MPFREDENDRHRAIDLQLDGTAVLSFSTQRVPPAVEKLLDYAGASKDEVDYFVFHQANRMINETIRKKLGLPVEGAFDPARLRQHQRRLPAGDHDRADQPGTRGRPQSRVALRLRYRPVLGTCLVDIGGEVPRPDRILRALNAESAK